MLDSIKLALRISHNMLDSEILTSIETARAEMIRAGVSPTVAMDEGNLLSNEAIKTYCKYQFTNDTKMQEGFLKSWEYQIDNLRKSY